MSNLPLMPQNVKPMQIRIRVRDEDVETLQALAGNSLQIATVASSLLGSALQAVRDNQGRLSFPPLLQVTESDLSRPRTSTLKPQRK